MEIKKAVITSAGKATRMRYISNVIPKALLPMFRIEDGQRFMRPAIDLIMDSLKSAGIQQFGVVLGARSKLLADYLFETNITIMFQKDPKGFGDAVLKSEEFVGDDAFFVHADDNFVVSGYREASQIFAELNPDCLLFLKKVDNPKSFGIADAQFVSEMHGHKVYSVRGTEEKPDNPKSDLGICAMYIFSPKIFEKLHSIKVEGELQLTAGIAKLIEDNCKVYGMLLNENETWLDLGNPDSYFETLKYSYTKM